MSALEMKYNSKILGILNPEHITNQEVQSKIEQAIGNHDDMLIIVKKRNLKWYGHITRCNGISKNITGGIGRTTGRRGRR